MTSKATRQTSKATSRKDTEIKRLRKVNEKLLSACKAKLQCLEGKEYDPDAFDEAAKLCRAAIAEATPDDT